MSIMSRIINKVNDVLNEEHLDSIAVACKFLQRKRKIRPKNFLENMLCLTLSSSASSLEELSLEFKKQDCTVTKSAVHKKISEAGVNFFKGVLESLFKHAFDVSILYLNALAFIKSIKVVDSSEIRLHKKLKIDHPHVRGQGAALKLQALMDAISGSISLLDIRKSKEPDQSYKSHLDHIEKNDLLIGDLGYFCVASFRLVEEKLGYFLFRFFKKQKFII
jgi:hypothetical protein